MVRRLFNVTLAVFALILLAPVWGIAYAGIRAVSPGPVFFLARRIGQGGREFTLYKFRTMHVGSDAETPITAAADRRVFPFGRWLRDWKIDELPQLLNIVKGDMAVVGPRPEDPGIVRAYYSDADRETLTVLPGLVSPGSIYNYTHGEAQLTGSDVVGAYVRRLLPIKLGLDRAYVRRSSLRYDVRLIARTAKVLIARAAGIRRFEEPPEMWEWRASGEHVGGADGGQV